MTNLDDLEDLLHRGEKGKAYELIKEDNGITAEILINEGISFGIIGDYKLSISYFEFAVKISEDDKIKEVARKKLAMIYNNRGNAYSELRRHEEAIEDYIKAIALDPKCAKAYCNRGSAHYEINQHEEAIEDYNKAIVLGLEYLEAYNNRGIAYCKLNKLEKAIEDFNTVIEINPEYTPAYSNRGAAYLELKQHEKALEDCNKAIELDPEDPEAYNIRGSAYRKSNQHEKAIDDYNKAIEHNPNFAGAYNNRGLAYYELNKHERAIDDYNKAIELNPIFAMAYYNRGLAYGKLNKHEKAIDDYTRAIELNPEDHEAYYDRGLTYFKLKQYEETIDDCTKAIELNPEDHEAYNNRGNAYYKLNNPEEAIDDYDKAIELNPKYAGAYSNRGSVYCGLRRNEEAIDDYNKAIELNPNLAVAYLNRGVTLVQTNEELDKAIEDFKQARGLFKGNDKERMPGFVEWAKARKELNMKNWDNFRERMNEAKEIFEKTNDSLSLSFAASINFSYLDEDLDNALTIPDPIEALKEIEKALKNPPEVEGLTDPERTIFGARILSFAILSAFISSVGGIEENTDLRMVKTKLAELLKDSREVEDAFESVGFAKGKTTIVDIISAIKEEIGIIEYSPNKKQKALEILKRYWSRLGPAIREMNGISTRETENISLRREIREMRSESRFGFAEMRGGLSETKEIISEGFKTSSEEHKAILETIYETKNILLQKDVVKARYRIEIQAPLISALSPISPKIIVDIPMGNLTEEQIKEKADEITAKLKDMGGKVKEEFLDAIKRVPETGEKLLKRLKNLKG
jgi:tetratricopeptide (TPR) repeat protein